MPNPPVKHFTITPTELEQLEGHCDAFRKLSEDRANKFSELCGAIRFSNPTIEVSKATLVSSDATPIEDDGN